MQFFISKNFKIRLILPQIDFSFESFDFSHYLHLRFSVFLYCFDMIFRRNDEYVSKKPPLML